MKYSNCSLVPSWPLIQYVQHLSLHKPIPIQSFLYTFSVTWSETKPFYNNYYKPLPKTKWETMHIKQTCPWLYLFFCSFNGISRFTNPVPISPKNNSKSEILLVKIFSLIQKTNQIAPAQGSTICIHGVCMYAWATCTYAWFVFCICGHYFSLFIFCHIQL